MAMSEKRLMGKDELNKILRDNIEKVTGLTVSLTDAWNIFKICIYTPFDLSNKQDVRVSIPKIGVFTTSKALESYKKGVPIKPKFYGSSGITDAMTAGESLVSIVLNSYTSKAEVEDKPAKKSEEKTTKKAEDKPAKKETKKPEPKVADKPIKEETKPKPVKKETKKAEPKVEVVEDITDIEDTTADISDDDFDFNFI